MPLQIRSNLFLTHFSPSLSASPCRSRASFFASYVQRKLRLLHLRSPAMDTKKLFVMSVWLACVIRVMSFVGLFALQMANIKVHYSLGSVDDGDESGDKNQKFYDKAVVVLFDLPDYIIVSAHVLMTMVWAECFMHSR